MMFKISMILGTLLCCLYITRAQRPFPSDPDSALLVTDDIDRFWKAFDIFWKDSTANPFQQMYIQQGTIGVQDFMKNRIRDSAHLRRTVISRKEQYEKSRPYSLAIAQQEKQCRSIFYAFKYLYPPAKFPPVYFVIGAFSSGGTSSENGLILGAEMELNRNQLPAVVAHELIHFQQQPTNNPTLLEQSIQEGVADFIAELICGVNTNVLAVEYGRKNKDTLCSAFVKRMNEKDLSNWLYGKPTVKGWPPDLGYWMGYEIANAYYQKIRDKKQAVHALINVSSAADLLNKSGYLDVYLKKP